MYKTKAKEKDMARKRAIVPLIEKRTQADKRIKRRIILFRISTYVFAAILLLGIVLATISRENDLVFGLIHVITGTLSLFYIGFVVYTEWQGWYTDYVRLRDREIFPCSTEDREEVKNELGEHKFLMIFIGAIYLGLSIYMLITGACALFDIG